MLILNFLLKSLMLAIIWQSLNVLFIFLKRKFLYLSGTVHKRETNLFNESLLLSGVQIQTIISLIKEILNWWSKERETVQLQTRKSIVLKNVVNHLNQTLFQDLGIKTVSPATTGGVDVWVYLAKNLNETEKNFLEDYFMGVLSKYTDEFGLDTLVVELNVGAGWVGKFDVKPIKEATYNRMTRQSSVEKEEDF
ncbi:hypothetical protein MK396_08805 [Streptococcus oralis]|uniref:hypothetical protein n=1 Tax=Streptococcus oralis TaxID=1303 RepID=UPI002283AE25|nr:hypothetical protein [Streptococcus oralis]MCY7085429.1 hypothetical protein [Streptococcus oralis]